MFFLNSPLSGLDRGQAAFPLSDNPGGGSRIFDRLLEENTEECSRHLYSSS